MMHGIISGITLVSRVFLSTISNIKDVYYALIIASTLLLVLAGTIEAYISPMFVRLLIRSVN